MSDAELHDAWLDLARSVRLAKLERSARVDAAMVRITSTEDRRGHSRMVKLPPMDSDEAGGKCRVMR